MRLSHIVFDWVEDIVKAYGKKNWDYPDPRCAFAPEMINPLEF